MSDSNARTLASYQAHVPAYIAGTTHDLSGPFRRWIDAALGGLQRDAAIMEIGSAFGRDAAYLREQGFAVDCTDATPAFVAHLRALGFAARAFNALTDPIEPGRDLILANAVLLHFDRDEFALVLAKAAGALKPGGRFAFSLKRGDGEGWSDHKLNAPRFFCYWQPEALPALLAQAGFSSWSIGADVPGRETEEWILVIARK